MEEYHQQLPTTTTATQPPFITNLIQHNLYLNQPTAAPSNPPTEANQPIPPNQQPTAASNQNYISNPFLLSNSHPDYTLLQSTPITPSPTNQQQPPFLTIHPPAQVLDSNIIPPTLNSQINYQQNHHPQLSISPSTNQLKTTNHPNNNNNNNNHLNSLQVIFPPPSPATSPTENENNKPSTTTSTSPSPNLNQNKNTIITSHPIPNQQDAINNNNNNKPSKSPKQKNPTHQLSQDFRRRKDWHKRLVEDVMDVLQVVSPTGELLFVSESMTRVTGFSTSELIGAQLASWCYHEEDHNNLDREIKNCFNAGPSGSLNFYCRFKKKNSSSCVIFEMMGHTMRVKTKPGFVSDDQSTKSEKQVMIITARPYPTSCGRLMDEFLELMLENETMIRLMGGEGGHGGGMETKLGGERSRGNSGTMAAGVMEADEVKNKKKRKSGELVEEISQESPSGKDSEGEEENHHPPPPPSGLPTIHDPHPSDPSQRARPRGPHKRERLDFLCLDCGVTQSPEWRKGPMGRKTLCNACGLRYAKKAK